MQPIRNIALSLLFTPTLLNASPNGSPVLLSCELHSLDFLQSGSFDISTQAIKLSDKATTPEGRHLLFNNDLFEVWIKTHAYRKTNDRLEVTGYAITLVDKENKLMQEATSVNMESPKPTDLISHTLDERFAPQGRLTVSCMPKITAQKN